MERALILAGFDRDLIGVNADAQIGAVSVGGDWIANSLVAGVSNNGGTASADDDNKNFGDGRDAKIAGLNVKDEDDARLVSRIASITLRGGVFGTSDPNDHFGFVAPQIGAFKSFGFTARLTAATDVPRELPLRTGDVTIREF